VSKPALSNDCDIADIEQWLMEMLKALQFARLIAAVVALVTRLRDLNTELTKQLASLKGGKPRSETLRRVERQLSLQWAMSQDAEQQDAAPPKKDAPAKQPKEHKSRKGKHPGRNAFPAILERVPTYNGVPLDQRRCPKCGLEMKTFGHTSCEYLDVVPAKVVVVRRTDEAIKCRLDEIIVSAPPPPRIMERGVLGNRLIIEATADKFIEHQPVERQCLRFARSGVEIAPQTLGRCVAAHIDILSPIAKAIEFKTRSAGGILATDATGIPVLDRDSPEGIRTGTMWGWTNALWVSFFYSPVGDSDSVRRFLDGEDEPDSDANYKRIVQADGTSLLTFIERAGGQRPGCWAHARRGLVSQAKSSNRVALEGIQLMAPLFKIERDSREAGENAAQRKTRRQQHSREHVDKVAAWVAQQRQITPPKSGYGKALGYIHRQWKRLILFLDDGNIPLTNNRRERELRKLVLGRKNWLFVWEDTGAKRTAEILTIVASCISHGLKPREYLVIVTQALLDGAKNIDELLPDQISVKYPELTIPGFEPPELPD
jgi:transposase